MPAPRLVVNLKRRARARKNKKHYRKNHPAQEGRAQAETAQLPAIVKDALDRAFKQMKAADPARPLSTVQFRRTVVLSHALSAVITQQLLGDARFMANVRQRIAKVRPCEGCIML